MPTRLAQVQTKGHRLAQLKWKVAITGEVCDPVAAKQSLYIRLYTSCDKCYKCFVYIVDSLLDLQYSGRAQYTVLAVT